PRSVVSQAPSSLSHIVCIGRPPNRGYRGSLGAAPPSSRREAPRAEQRGGRPAGRRRTGRAPRAGRVIELVGRVVREQSQELTSPALGGTTAFSYFVPPACAPASGRRCPVLYLLHGFGGDYTSMLGTAAHPSAWVASVGSGPPVDPHRVADPWNYSDPAHWV